MFILYKFITFLATPYMRCAVEKRIKLGKEDPIRYREKFGIYTINRPIGNLIWIHCASIGESLSVLPMVKDLDKRNVNVLITTGTVTSANVIAQKFPKNTIHQFAPLDSPLFVGKFFNHFKPDVAIFVESEFWPNLIFSSKKHCKALYLLNARLSPKTIKQWSKFRLSFLKLMKTFNKVWVSDIATIDFLNKCNISYKQISSLKYDAAQDAMTSDTPNNDTEIKGTFILAISTHIGENDDIVKAYANLSKKTAGLRLIIIPRHSETIQDIKDSCDKSGLTYTLRSEVSTVPSDSSVYIVNTFGEVNTFLPQASIVLVGGSFIPNIGGHNVLEPAIFGKPIVIGQFYDNFKNIVDDMASETAIIIAKTDTIEPTLQKLIYNKVLRETLAVNAKYHCERRCGDSIGIVTELLKVL